jgi:hypothetical protein
MPSALDQLVILVSDLVVYGLLVIVIATAVGAAVGRGAGAVVLGALALLAVACCAVIAVPLEFLGAQRWILVVLGLVLALLLAGLGWLLATSQPGRRRAAITWPALWLGFVLACAIGYGAGGRVGLLTITAPAVVVFWGALIHLARFVLPLEPAQRQRQAAQVLITTILGLNHPLRVLVGREVVERVSGYADDDDDEKQRSVIWSGVVLTGPDHVVAVTDRLRPRGVRGPGVVFTGRHEDALLPLDLRPQLREFTVEAISSDGIRIQLRVAGVFQLDARPPDGSVPAVALGGPFPFRREKINTAVYARPVEIHCTTDGNTPSETRQQCSWDDLYPLIATHILQDIIRRRTFDQLCEPGGAGGIDPARAVADLLDRRLRQRMANLGIRHIAVTIRDLQPQAQERVQQQMVDSWRAPWQRDMLEAQGAVEAEFEELLGQARAAAQAMMISWIGKAIADVSRSDPAHAARVIALRFVDSLQRMVTGSDLNKRLSPEVLRSIDGIRRVIGGEPPPASAGGPSGPTG